MIIDLIVGYFQFKILIILNYDENKSAKLVGYLWLWNPLVAFISCKGNGDSIISLLVILMLFKYLKK